MRPVLIDTCIWVPFFNRPQSSQKHAVDALLDEDRATLTGPIVAEILQGFRHEAQANYVGSHLRGMHYVEPTWDDWQESARLGRRLAAVGHRLPLSDLIIAAIAKRIDAEVYTSDPHFDLIEGLKRYRS